MTLYRCVWYSKSGLQPGIHSIHAESDSHARKLAFDMLRANPGLDRVEVWLGGDLAFRLNRRQARLESACLSSDL